MNRFRTKKKAKDTNDVTPRQSNDLDTTVVPVLKPSMTFRKGKKNTEPEKKPEIDLANALPSSDDFRTSLLMSGLSARFSMLREQDDPSSKLGKASDDSVLFPKRQSRLVDFGFSSKGLTDIAEVSSIKSSARPLAQEHVDSYHSIEGSGVDDDTASNSNIMARSKPAHGNNLFGGRQKIYKIPANGSASMKNLASAETGAMGGRILYDDDINMSAFQKLREQEKRQREQERIEAEETQPSSPRRSHSPSLSDYNRNRETSSTTDSGPSLTRSSTAATSVTSQRAPSVAGHTSSATPKSYQTNTGGVERSGTKSKRLYETGLDHHLHNQQHSAMSRLDSLSRQRQSDTREFSPSMPSPTVTTFNSPEISATNGPQAAQSPDQKALGQTTGTFETSSYPIIMDTPKIVQGMSPPLSPPMSDGDDQHTLPIQPNDRGKATALGAFSKPAQLYDEKKYMQRQLQMQQVRTNPAPHSFTPNQQTPSRMRAESGPAYSSEGPRLFSAAQRELMTTNRPFAPSTRVEPPTPLAQNGTAQTVISPPNGSSLDSRRDIWSDKSVPINRPPPFHLENLGRASSDSRTPPPEFAQPIGRPSDPEPLEETLVSKVDGTVPVQSSEAPKRQAPSAPLVKDGGDSPTLGPGTGLSGLVRQHLRSDSNSSSLYGTPSQNATTRYHSELRDEHDYNSTGNPWELNDWDQDFDVQNLGGSDDYAKPDAQGGEIADQHTENFNTDVDKENQTPGVPAWEMEMRKHHTRDDSTATQKESDEFASELAARRKRVQENLRSIADPESRSASPIPGMDRPRDHSATRSTPRGVFKAIPGRDTLAVKARDGPSKARKMLGLGNNAVSNGSSPNSQGADDTLWKQEEEEMLRGVPKAPRVPQTKDYRQARRGPQREHEQDAPIRHQPQIGEDPLDSNVFTGHHETRSNHQTPNMEMSDCSPSKLTSPSRERTYPVHQQRAPSEEGKRSGSRPPSRAIRDRSSSDISGRSKSRNGRYRDDLAKAMAEGTGSSAQTTLEEIPSMRGPSRSPALGFNNAQDVEGPLGPTFGRPNADGRSGFLDGQQIHNQPDQTEAIGMAPRPSPVTPFSVNSTPALAQPTPAKPIPVAPSNKAFQSQIPIHAARKRSVNKSDISEPILLSSTSRVTTINLPPGTSLQSGGNASAPPVPPINPRRRQTRTQTMFGVLTGRSAESLPTPSLPLQTYPESFTNFSADEEEPTPKPRQRLRKSSSEGGNLNARARAAFNAQPTPALPDPYPPSASALAQEYEGGMF